MIALLLSVLPSLAGTITASSTADTEWGKTPAALAADGLLSTSWHEGASGDGKGEWLELDLGKATAIQSISIWPGDMRQGKRSFRESGRPQQIRVLVDGKQVGDAVRLLDQMQRLDIPMSANGRKIRIVIDEAYGGLVYSHTAIAEVAVNFPDLGAASAGWQAWLQSPAAQKAQEKFEAELQAQYAAYKQAEFGDRAALAWILEAVAEGEPHVRQEAQRRIEVGYRAQAIHSSAKAQEAARKLKDANAIPAFEMAMLRAVGQERVALADMVEIFYAYQELIGNRGKQAPPFGESGYWKGALRGFGEPLAIERDPQGNLYVADIGNSRVQRFGESGLVNRTWGAGEEEITEAWFQKGRPYYPSGNTPGEEPTAFWNPVDVELLPAKDGTGMAVLDARGQVRVFDASGALTASFTASTDGKPTPKVGGTSHLAWFPKRQRLLVLIGDEAVLYDLQGNEQGRWETRRGSPNAVEVYKGSVLLLGFRDEVWRYTMDGFPHSVLINREQLGKGYEQYDLSVDEAGRLWALTDDGVAHKFKKPGKLDFQIKVADYSLQVPRFAVAQGILWYTNDDRIVQVDAEQKRLDAETATEGGTLDLDKPVR